jgi:eukaryotic-like serine/threonine-protein kinase
MKNPIEPGTILAGKYRVERVLGSGGMGMVLAAHHLQLDEKVAIKLLQPELLEHAEATARFLREARAAVKIKSEYVARVSDVGSLESGAPYMVMEYLEGEDLADLLARGPIPREQAVELVLQACEALGEAHALGIIHRDIKPANFYCVRRTDGLLAMKLLDFGISRATGGAELALTSSGAVMGSPQYMAPEQMLAARNADARSDIWSLGAVLFEVLVGEPPVVAETFAELVIEVTRLDSAKLAVRMQNLPPGLTRATLRCLDVDPAGRYQSVGELAVALVPFGPVGRAQLHADRVLRIARVSQHPSSPPPARETTDRPEHAARPGKSLMPVGRTSGDALTPGKPGSHLALLAAGGFVSVALAAAWWGLARPGATEARPDASGDTGVSHAATGAQAGSAPPGHVLLDAAARPSAVSDVAQPIPHPSADHAPEPQAVDRAKAEHGAKSKKGKKPVQSTPTPDAPRPAPDARTPSTTPTDADKHELGGRL